VKNEVGDGDSPVLENALELSGDLRAISQLQVGEPAM
jgi:hypothetical protein